MFTRLSLRCRQILGARWFLLVVLGWFSLGAIVMALTSKYPMAFDENWHMGLIKIYAQHWLPFGIEKTSDMAALGSATSDPSYLFHYLMSFPYRFFMSFGFGETGTIIALRLINVAMFVGALLVFRMVLRALRCSRALSNSLIAVVTLLPVVPLLASEVNYDNLMLIFAGLVFLLTIMISRDLMADRPLSLAKTLTLIVVTLIGGSVKYAFLPLAAASVLWLIGLMIYQKTSIKQSLSAWKKAVSRPNWKLLTLAGFVVLGSLFFSRDVYNLVTYHKISPPCDTFFSVDECENYGPWARDYHHRQTLDTRHPNFHPKSYPAYLVEDWVPGMTMRLFFTLAGPGVSYQTRESLPVPIVVFSALFWIGIAAALAFCVRIVRKNPLALYAALVIVVYCLALSFEVYNAYRSTAEPVAINGRYLLPLAPLLGLLVAAGWRELARKAGFSIALPIVALACLVLVALQGGGSMTYFALSYPGWFYEGAAQNMTNSLRDILKYIVPTNWSWEKLFNR